MIPQVPGNSPIDSSPCLGSSSHVPVTAQQTEQSREQRVGATVSTRLPSSSTSSSSFRSPSLTPFSPASSSSWPSPSTKSPRKPVLKNRGDFGSSVLRSVVATGIDLVLGNAETRIPEKRGLVDAAKAIMRENLPDHPQFIALVEMLNLIIFPKILERLEEHSHDKIALSLLERQELLKEMIAINLAQGFANLSKKMSNSRTSSSSLVDLILTLCQAGSCRINAKQLATIEERSRSHRASFRHLRRELLPSLVSRQNHLIESFLIKYSIVANSPSRHDVEIQKQQKAKETIIRDLFSELSPTMPDHVRQDFLEQLEKRDSNPENRNQLSLQLAEKIVNNLIHEYIQSSDSTRKSSIENSLFNTTDHTASKITFINSLNEMHGHQKRLRKIFESVAGEILKELFPLEANSLTLPSSLVPKGYLYDEIKKFLTNFLLQTYEPLENDLARNAEWEAELRSRVGGQDLSLFMHTPAALLVGFTKHFIQTSPDAVGLIAEFLGAQLVPPVPQEPETFPKADEERARKQQLLLAQLTQNQLAEWIIDSIRILLHSEDSLGLGDFAKRACGNLTLALMAKGTELAFSEEASSASSSSGRQINEDLFFKELADRITP
jgi:hypothetical protein